jgi:hypothetical protein
VEYISLFGGNMFDANSVINRGRPGGRARGRAVGARARVGHGARSMGSSLQVVKNASASALSSICL